MFCNRTLLAFIIFLFIGIIFFNKSFFQGQVPFPGDLLVGNYEPYRSFPDLGYAAGGVPHKAQGPDVIRQLIPWKYFSIEEIKNGRLPLWNPYNFSGNPLLANFQSGVFYPFNAAFLIFDFETAWTIYIFLIPLLSAFFVYLFMREIGMNRIASYYAGIVFAFSSYMVVWMEYGNIGHVFLWLPLLLYLIEKLVKKIAFIHAIAFVGVSALAFLAGYIQGYFYVVCVFSLYYFFRLWQEKHFTPFHIGLLIFFLFTPLLIGMVQLLPTLELFINSSRSNYSLDQIRQLLNPAWYTVTTFIPNFFGNPATRNHWFYGTYIERVSYFGIYPLLFAFFALFLIKINKYILPFAIIFAASFLISLDLIFTRYLYLLPIPILSTTVPTRVLSLFVFSGSILSGIGLHYFLMRKEKKRMLAIISLFALLFLVVGISIFTLPQFIVQFADNKNIALRNTILPAVFFIIFIFIAFSYYNPLRIRLFKSKYIKIAAVCLLIGITLFDLFFFFEKITPFSPREYFYPKTQVMDYLRSQEKTERFWGFGSGNIENNFATIEQVYSPEGYDPLFSKRYSELLSITQSNGINGGEVYRSDANIRSSNGERVWDDEYFQKLSNILGVKYILNKVDLHDASLPDYHIFPEETYELLWGKGNWQVYENKNVLPRFYLVDNYIVRTNRDDILSEIFLENIDLKNVAILEESTGLDLGNDENAAVKLLKYEPQRVTFSVNSNKNMLLVLSDTYFPGWIADIDGKRTKIYRANYTFRAVEVPRGAHTVTFAYSPSSFLFGFWISVLSVFCIILLLCYKVILKNKKHEK